MKKVFFLSISFVCFSMVCFADEGMWLPQFLQTLNEKQMKKLGMKINASDIYNINKSSLKDAIVSLGGFCTAEVISEKGLILTNHHCGFDAVQNHSTLEHNYIKEGFWAYNTKQELTNEGLYATFIVRIDDITIDVLKNVTTGLSEKERQSIIDKNIATLKTTVKKESYQEVLVKPFFEGNKYYLFVTETYNDVRLVGAPPASIGNFGKDTDNWMWPRHTGDFSMFRIYADKNNKPAKYSPDNVPYSPKKALKISLDGTKEGDFTMVFGFPGKTNQYLSSAAIQQTVDVNDPTKIKIREKALHILDGYMRNDEQIKIQYAAKYANIENAYKKWKGEVLGLKSKDGVGKRKLYEAEFLKRIGANTDLNNSYGTLLSDLELAYKRLEALGYARDYFNEIIPKIGLFEIAPLLNSLLTAHAKDEASFEKRKKEVQEKLVSIYNEYNAGVDQKLFEGLIAMYVKDQPAENISPMLTELLNTNGNDYPSMSKYLFEKTMISSGDKVKLLMNGSTTDIISSIKNDAACKLYTDIFKTFSTKIVPPLNEVQNEINRLQRSYMQAQITVFKEKNFYPDANNTLRVTYGNVKGFEPRDGIQYDYYTYLDGVMEKYKPGDYEFDVPQKLIDLYNKKDFGQYGVKGKQPVCFLGSNHTTGGNSGSPALDAYGNLVGLNFDRVWEGTMSDINYDPAICRNIMVDIRYVLFIVDKYAGAKNLISELTLVHPKKK